ALSVRHAGSQGENRHGRKHLRHTLHRKSLEMERSNHRQAHAAQRKWFLYRYCPPPRRPPTWRSLATSNSLPVNSPHAFFWSSVSVPLSLSIDFLVNSACFFWNSWSFS